MLLAAATTRAQERPVDDMRVQDIPVHQDREPLPAFRDVLSLQGRPLAVKPEHQRHVALVEIGDQEACLYWSNRRSGMEAYRGLMARARGAGYTVNAVFEASEMLLQTFYGARNETVAVEYHGEMDDLFNELLIGAIQADASDIHIRIRTREAHVRLRIHGEMLYMRPLARETAMSMVRAIFSNTDPRSRRGHATFTMERDTQARLERRITVRLKGETQTREVRYQLRWQSMPHGNDGVNVILRVLPTTTSKIRSLEALGFMPAQCELLGGELMRRSSGLILVAGITGAGKSTTLATLATEWIRTHQDRLNLVTIEDPIEYDIPGAGGQHQVSRADGDDKGEHTVTFASVLRAALRADPDAMLVGEVRDHEVAEITVHAVETGHLVMTTLHAQSPFVAVDRLVELSRNRHAIATDRFLLAAMYQKLVPTLCPACKVPWTEVANRVLPPVLFDHLYLELNGDVEGVFFRGPGCERCQQLGVAGRVVVAEILTPDIEQLDLISERKNNELAAHWRGGLSTINKAVQGKDCGDHALWHIRRGEVSPLDADLAIDGFMNRREPGIQAAWYHQRRGARAGEGRRLA